MPIFHHAGLLNSLILLFEGRFRGFLARPIGKEWYNEGFWAVYDHPATIEQYLGIGSATPDGTPPLNEVQDTENSGLYFCRDIASGFLNKAVTLDYFLNHDFDLVIASVPQHVRPFRKLCERHPKKPKLIYQIGNDWNIEKGDELLIDGIMASALLKTLPEIPYLIYHQEFDLKTFSPGFAYPPEKISTFVNCFNTAQLFAFDWAIFQEVEKSLPDWEFKSFGGGCRDGVAAGDAGVAEEMKKARFIWHTKSGGDGYGHVIHNTGAVARPPIVRMTQYYGKLAEVLLKDEETCLAIDNLSIPEIVKKIEHFSRPDRWLKMAKAHYSNFSDHVDFDKEAKMIDNFLRKLL